MNGLTGWIFGGLASLALMIGVMSMDRYDPRALSQSSVQISDYCSGTVIEDPDKSNGIQHTILTAKHCFEYSGTEIGEVIPVNVVHYDGVQETYGFILTHLSEKSDLALLQIDGDFSVNLPTKVYEGNVSFGDKVWSVSFPLAWGKLVTQGYYGNFFEDEFLKTFSTSGVFAQSSAQTAPASSGSGLFIQTSSGYKLIGVLFGGAPRHDYMSLYTPLGEIRGFLESFDGQEGL